MANTTWNPSDLVSVTLSNGNLTAACPGSCGVRAVDKQGSGKFYFEVTATTWTGTQPVLGVALASAPLATIGSTPTGCACLASNSGLVYINGSNSGVTGVASPANGQIIGVAVDIDNKLIWFRVCPSGIWNNNAAYAPGGTGGVSFAVLNAGPAHGLFPVVACAFASANFTANFGGSAFSGAVPSGFTSGWLTSSIPNSAVATQASLEQFVTAAPPAQVTQVSLEHFVTSSPLAQVTQVALEEWARSNPALQVTQVALEEWTSSAAAVTRALVTQVALEEWASAAATKVPGAGEVDAAATVTGAGVVLAVAPGAGEADAAATVTGAGALAISGVGRVDAGATVTGAGAVIHAVTGAGEVDAGADVEGAGFQVAVGTGEVDAFADVRGMGALITPPGALPFLPGLGWSVHRRPTFDTIVATHPSGSEVRLALWQNCLWEFELTYDALASNAAYPGAGNQTLQTLLGFYLARGGQHGTFLFIDPDFNAMAAQGIGAGDGTTIVFPFYRVFGGQVEPVSWVTNVGAVYLDGVAQPSGWTVSGNTISFDAAPASGVVISADFSYGFMCRFLEDTLDFEEFMDNLWQLKSLKFRQVRQ